jgi:hypothetical protein
MTAEAPDFASWLREAAVPEATLRVTQRAVLQAAFHFLQRCGRDYTVAGGEADGGINKRERGRCLAICEC